MSGVGWAGLAVALAGMAVDAVAVACRVAALDLLDARVHDARHFGATMLLEQRVDIRVVQEMLIILRSQVRVLPAPPPPTSS